MTGRYKARAMAAQLTTTKGDREYVAVKFRLSDDQTQSFLWNGFFGDKVDKGGKTLTQRTFEALRVCGLPPDNDLEKLSLVCTNEVSIELEEEEYEGQLQTRVKWINALMPPAMDAARAKAFAAQMKAKMNGEKPARDPGFDGTPPDDVIPF